MSQDTVSSSGATSMVGQAKAPTGRCWKVNSGRMSSAPGKCPPGKIWAANCPLITPSVVNWATNTRLSSPAIPFVWPGGAMNQPPPMLSSIEKLLPASNSLSHGSVPIVLTSPPALSALVVAPMVTYESHSASGATTIMAGLMLPPAAAPNGLW